MSRQARVTSALGLSTRRAGDGDCSVAALSFSICRSLSVSLSSFAATSPPLIDRCDCISSQLNTLIAGSCSLLALCSISHSLSPCCCQSWLPLLFFHFLNLISLNCQRMCRIGSSIGARWSAYPFFLSLNFFCCCLTSLSSPATYAAVRQTVWSWQSHQPNRRRPLSDNFLFKRQLSLARLITRHCNLDCSWSHRQESLRQQTTFYLCVCLCFSLPHQHVSLILWCFQATWKCKPVSIQRSCVSVITFSDWMYESSKWLFAWFIYLYFSSHLSPSFSY